MTSRPTAPGAATENGWLAVVLAVATLLAAAAGLGVMTTTLTWWIPTLVSVAVVTVVALVGQWLRLPWPPVLLAQLVALAVSVRVQFGLGSPGALWAAMAQALHEVNVAVPPLDVPELVELLIALALALTAVLVIQLVRVAPATVGIPVLGVIMLVATIARPALPWWTLAPTAVGYFALLAVTANGRGARGGGRAARVSARAGGGGAGGARAGGGRSQPRERTVVHRRAAGALVGAATAWTVIAVGAGLLAMPLASQVSTTGLLARPASGEGTFANPTTALVGDLLRQEEIPLLEVTGQSRPDYLRTAVLTQWLPGEGWALGEPVAGASPVAEPGRGEQVQVTTLGFASEFLPVPDGVMALVEGEQGWSYDPDRRMWFRQEGVDPERIVAQVDPRQPEVSALLADTVTPRPDEVDVGDLPAQVVDLAREVAGDGPAFAQAQALQQWFTDPANGFSYSLEVPRGDTGDPLLDFLEQRQGYCQQYASALGVMLRALGIPARVVIGFGGGTTGLDGVTTLTSHDAHAWVEARFDRSGWVRFDPTPAAPGQTRVPGFTEPEAEETATAEPTTSATTAPDDGATAAPQPGATAQIDDGATAPVSVADSARATRVLLGWAVVVVLGLAVAFGPHLVRELQHRSRMRRIRAGGPRAAAQAWQEMLALAQDHDLAIPVTMTVRAGAAELARRLDLSPRARRRLELVVTAVEQDWYGPPAPPDRRPSDQRHAPPSSAPAPAAELAAAVTEVHSALARSFPLTGTRAWLPRSLRGPIRETTTGPEPDPEPGVPSSPGTARQTVTIAAHAAPQEGER